MNANGIHSPARISLSRPWLRGRMVTTGSKFFNLIQLKILIVAVCFFQASNLFGVTHAIHNKPPVESNTASVSGRDFPTDPFVRRQVRFWEAVFQKYQSNSVIIHDLVDPLAMIDVINFDHYITNAGNVTSIASSEQTNLVKNYISRYDVAVERFAKFKEAAVKFGPIEQRLNDVYSKDPASLTRLYKGDVKFRGQGGLSDTFISAAARAQEYMPYMERAFRQYGLPVSLTRLPFVESMFNLQARSKVGASGIWQFMPQTAREFMYVGTLVDERNNPYKATHAAAQLFLENYRELKSWPLAITAYNHGRGGMSKAAKAMGTNQLGNIISNYKSSSFGFASKNFYAEFLAAARTYELVTSTGLVKAKIDSPAMDIIALSKPATLRSLSRITSLSPEAIAKLNPCLSTNITTKYLDEALPKSYEIRLPKSAAAVLRRSQPGVRVSKTVSQTIRR